MSNEDATFSLQGGIRKRLKTSSGESIVTAMSDKAERSNQRALSVRDAIKKNNSTATEQDKALRTLKTDFDALRQLIMCKICDRFLVVITETPAPSYVIREMTLVLVSRDEHLPAGETVEQHRQWQKEEASIVQKDKSDDHPRTGGLFKGCFKRHEIYRYPLHDPGDGIERCPECHWELEDGVCDQCGLSFPDDEDAISDDAADELLGLSDAITLDGDIDLDDDENFIEFPHGEREDYAVDWPDRPLEEAYHNRHTRPPVIYGIQTRASGRQLFSLGRTTANQVRAALTRHSSDSHDASSSPSESGASNYFGYHDGGEQDDDEEAYGGSSLDGFIDDGEGDTQSENSDVSIAGSLQHNRQYPIHERRRRVVHSVSDPSDAEVGDHTSGAPDGSDSDSDTNEEGPVSRGSPRAVHRPRNRPAPDPSVGSGDEESSDGDDEAGPDSVEHYHGWSPLQPESVDQPTEHASEGDSSAVAWNSSESEHDQQHESPTLATAGRDYTRSRSAASFDGALTHDADGAGPLEHNGHGENSNSSSQTRSHGRVGKVSEIGQLANQYEREHDPSASAMGDSSGSSDATLRSGQYIGDRGVSQRVSPLLRLNASNNTTLRPMARKQNAHSAATSGRNQRISVQSGDARNSRRKRVITIDSDDDEEPAHRQRTA
ncbi:E3 ubiquitin ligase [Elasticomyces elasticus]|nr:E3 ubiquitin ligase [Elasticomyces elasticus]